MLRRRKKARRARTARKARGSPTQKFALGTPVLPQGGGGGRFQTPSGRGGHGPDGALWRGLSQSVPGAGRRLRRRASLCAQCHRGVSDHLVQRSDDWAHGAAAFEGYSGSDSPFLNGMQSRDWSVDGGVNIEAATPVGLLGLSIVTDLLGRYRGQEVEFRYLIMFPLLGFNWIPSGGVRWKSDNLVDYYYGVRPDEARPDRPPPTKANRRSTPSCGWSSGTTSRSTGVCSAMPSTNGWPARSPIVPLSTRTIR